MPLCRRGHARPHRHRAQSPRVGRQLHTNPGYKPSSCSARNHKRIHGLRFLLTRNQGEFFRPSTAKAAKSANPRSSTQIHEVAARCRAANQLCLPKSHSAVFTNVILLHCAQNWHNINSPGTRRCGLPQRWQESGVLRMRTSSAKSSLLVHYRKSGCSLC